jgi:uncharacterized protein YgbK (DUF1537 family)
MKPKHLLLIIPAYFVIAFVTAVTYTLVTGEYVDKPRVEVIYLLGIGACFSYVAYSKCE